MASRTRVTWTCLEVFLWGDSNLSCQQSSPLAKCQTRISSSSSIQKKPQDSTSWQVSIETARSSHNSTRMSLVHFSLWSHKRSSAKKQGQSFVNKDQQSTHSPNNSPLSAGLYLYPFQTSHVLFPGSFQKNTMCLFSAKHPLITQFSEKRHMTQLSLQRNQKFHFTWICKKKFYILEDIYFTCKFSS